MSSELSPRQQGSQVLCGLYEQEHGQLIQAVIIPLCQRSSDYSWNTVSSLGTSCARKKLKNHNNFSRMEVRALALLGETEGLWLVKPEYKGALWTSNNFSPCVYRKVFRKSGPPQLHMLDDDIQWHELKLDMFMLDMWKKFLTLRTAQHWDRLPRQALQSPAVEVSKIQQGKALSSQIRPQSYFPCCEQKVGIETSWCPVWTWNGFDSE